MVRLVFLPLWLSVAEGRAEEEVRALPPKMQERWRKLKAASKKKKKAKGSKPDPARTFVPGLLHFFLSILGSVDAPPSDHSEEVERKARVAYCERFVEWLIDLESQLPTRRFFHLVLQDAHVVEQCRLSGLPTRPEGNLFRQLVNMLEAFTRFSVNNYSGEALTVRSSEPSLNWIFLTVNALCPSFCTTATGRASDSITLSSHLYPAEGCVQALPGGTWFPCHVQYWRCPSMLVVHFHFFVNSPQLGAGAIIANEALVSIVSKSAETVG